MSITCHASCLGRRPPGMVLRPRKSSRRVRGVVSTTSPGPRLFHPVPYLGRPPACVSCSSYDNRNLGVVGRQLQAHKQQFAHNATAQYYVTLYLLPISTNRSIMDVVHHFPSCSCCMTIIFSPLPPASPLQPSPAFGNNRVPQRDNQSAEKGHEAPDRL